MKESVDSKMTIDCLIVVDAFDRWPERDLKKYPFLDKETKLFGQYLNHTINLIRPNCRIFHARTIPDRPLMKEIDTSQDTIIDEDQPSLSVLPNFDNYYICGFHLSRCIQHKADKLFKQGKPFESIRIVLNMSMMFPGDTLTQCLRHLKAENTYMYNHGVGFQKLYDSLSPGNIIHSFFEPN